MQNRNLNISESEWKIMKVLWEKPNLTLKEIAVNLSDSDWSYTTIRTLVTRLAEKGAINADKSANNFLYSPSVSENECKCKEVSQFLSRVFDGSVSMLVSTLTRDSNLTEEEQEELMSIIQKIDS
jgi:BlaI family penicillinase repressor